MFKSLRTRSGLVRLSVLCCLVAFVGAAVASAAPSPGTAVDPTEVQQAAGPDGAATDRQIPGNQSPAHLPSTDAPRPASLAVAGTGSELGTHFAGLTFHNQRRNADGGNQLSLEPPDQGLCVGNGEVIEPVNDLFTTYDAATGARTGGYESLNQFFFGEHQINRTVSPPIFGKFISDPRCYYDTSSGHFFMTILMFGRDPSTGAFEAPGTFQIATSKTGTPSTSPSDWNFFSVDVTNDGRNGEQTHAGCPCFGDQPLVGIDANGVYISTNEYPIDPNTPGFNGAQVYAIQKSALIAGTTPNVVRFEGPNGPVASNDYVDGIPYSLQPALSPSAADFATANNGTEYLLGALEFGKKPFQLDNRVAVWALTNTASLNKGKPALKLTEKVISSETYGFPPSMVQPNGPTPLADSFKDHESLVDGGDDRMQAAVYAHGHLWGASDTIAKTPTGSSQVAVAYYMVAPSVDSSGNVTSSSVVAKQGYLSVNGDSVTRPALAVTALGKVVIGVSLVGPDYFPSAAYTTFDDSASSAPSTLHIVAPGTVPDDGFTAYHAEGGNGVGRWGDYAFAAVDGNSIWVANEWIPALVQGPDLANWGTSVSKITP
ncbi:MAG: hypothetical protein ACJ768_22430 [Gaiellaceae bacterium]